MSTFPSKLMIRKGDVEIELRGTEELIRERAADIAKIAGALAGEDLSELKNEIESKKESDDKDEGSQISKKELVKQRRKKESEESGNEELSLFDEDDFKQDGQDQTDILKRLPENLEDYLEELDFSYLKQPEKALLTGYHLQQFSEEGKFSTRMLTEHARNNGISLTNPSMCISRLEADKSIQANGKASSKEPYYQLTYEGKEALRNLLNGYRSKSQITTL